MTKINQSILGANGDCFRACISSLLDIENIECVPHFVKLFPENSTTGASIWLLKYFDLYLFPMLCYQGNILPKQDEIYWKNKPIFYPVNQHYIVSGYTERNTHHACIGYNGEIVHDPHPLSTGLTEIYMYELLLSPGDSVRVYDNNIEAIRQYNVRNCPYEYYGVDTSTNKR